MSVERLHSLSTLITVSIGEDIRRGTARQPRKNIINSNEFFEALKEAEQKIIALTSLYDKGELGALDNGDQRQKEI